MSPVISAISAVHRVGLVALDARSARLLPWKANLNEHAVASVDEVPWQLAAVGQTVYVSHTGFDAFERVGGLSRDGFAALDARTGAAWSARATLGRRLRSKIDDSSLLCDREAVR